MKQANIDHIQSSMSKLFSYAEKVEQVNYLREDAGMLYVQGHFAESEHQHAQADIIEDELRDLAYINACESDSPNSPDFENVLNAELLKLGIEE